MPMTKKRLWWWRVLFACLMMGGDSVFITKKQAIEEFLEQGGAIRIGFKTYGKGDPYP